MVLSLQLCLKCPQTRTDYLNSKSNVNARGFKYLILDAKKAFNHLRHAFIKASILQHFCLERHIRVQTNVSVYAIGGVLSQMTLDNLG